MDFLLIDYSEKNGNDVSRLSGVVVMERYIEIPEGRQPGENCDSFALMSRNERAQQIMSTT